MFYTFYQNMLKGSFIRDDVRGIAEVIIIQAPHLSTALHRRLLILGSDSLESSDCDCERNSACILCGVRWPTESDETDVPSIRGEDLNKNFKHPYIKQCFVHTTDGSILKYEFK